MARWGRPADCSAWIRFTDFDRVLSDLARILKPGGLLVIRHANFRFGDTSVAGLFECLRGEAALGSPIYGRDDCLLPGVTGTTASTASGQRPLPNRA